MSENKKIEKNDEVASKINLSLMGSPGAGKTSTLIQIIKRLDGITPYVIEGDIESDFDTKTLLSMGVKTIQRGACHLDSPLIGKAVDDQNIGNLVCPAP